jgi:hypothetical protein
VTRQFVDKIRNEYLHEDLGKMLQSYNAQVLRTGVSPHAHHHVGLGHVATMNKNVVETGSAGDEPADPLKRIEQLHEQGQTEITFFREILSYLNGVTRNGQQQPAWMDVSTLCGTDVLIDRLNQAFTDYISTTWAPLVLKLLFDVETAARERLDSFGLPAGDDPKRLLAKDQKPELLDALQRGAADAAMHLFKQHSPNVQIPTCARACRPALGTTLPPPHARLTPPHAHGSRRAVSPIMRALRAVRRDSPREDAESHVPEPRGALRQARPDDPGHVALQAGPVPKVYRARRQGAAAHNRGKLGVAAAGRRSDAAPIV